jgi:RNA polymerase sigma-70 factor (ECF subfamily)
LGEQAQVALILHILCGFSIGEIASAFVSGHSAIEKHMSRAKKVLARSKKLFDVTVPIGFAARLPSVQRALYLLFNEGYHGASPQSAVRAELCQEAMRLTAILLQHPLGATSASYALSALMCLNAARLPARMDSAGNLASLFDQDRSRWDAKLVQEGLKLLELSATGSELTAYHIEAAIASVHSTASRPQDTNWARIVSLYDALMAIHPSPIVALNRAIAVAQHIGPERGLKEIGAIKDRDRLAGYPFYTAAIAELELRLGRHEIAREYFRASLALARNASERRFLQQRMAASDSPRPENTPTAA